MVHGHFYERKTLVPGKSLSMRNIASIETEVVMLTYQSII